jgi:hypothetical protein
MVMNFDSCVLGCQCNVYVIPESIRRKDLGYKGYEPGIGAAFKTCCASGPPPVKQLLRASKTRLGLAVTVHCVGNHDAVVSVGFGRAGTGRNKQTIKQTNKNLL